jgi:excisionase family DNA binding protein
MSVARVVPIAPAGVPTLDEVAADATRAAALPPAVRAQLLARCAAVLAALSGAMAVDADRPSPQSVAESEPDRLLTVCEAARLMGFAPSYVYEMARRGDLPTVRRKKYVRVRRSAVERWITEHEQWGGCKSISTMLNTVYEQRGSAAIARTSRTQPDAARRETRRASRNGVPLGNRRCEDPGTDRATAGDACQDREDTTTS